MVTIDTSTMDQIPALSLEDRRDTLYSRLESGYAKIERAAARGEDVTRWENGWTRLLREYERVCEQIASRRDGYVSVSDSPTLSAD